jgi:hypothetical protein
LITQTEEKNGLEREIERERILLGELAELSVRILEIVPRTRPHKDWRGIESHRNQPRHH